MIFETVNGDGYDYKSVRVGGVMILPDTTDNHPLTGERALRIRDGNLQLYYNGEWIAITGSGNGSGFKLYGQFITQPAGTIDAPFVDGQQIYTDPALIGLNIIVAYNGGILYDGVLPDRMSITNDKSIGELAFSTSISENDIIQIYTFPDDDEATGDGRPLKDFYLDTPATDAGPNTIYEYTLPNNIPNKAGDKVSGYFILKMINPAEDFQEFALYVYGNTVGLAGTPINEGACKIYFNMIRVDTDTIKVEMNLYFSDDFDVFTINNSLYYSEISAPANDPIIIAVSVNASAPDTIIGKMGSINFQRAAL